MSALTLHCVQLFLRGELVFAGIQSVNVASEMLLNVRYMKYITPLQAMTDTDGDQKYISTDA
jgi:hypothetical protein